MALARALAIEPQVLLLDEPLSALDAKIRVSLRDEIRAIQRQLGITTVYVTHDQEEALSLSDRIVVMSEGRVEQIGTPFEIYNFPATALRRLVRRHAQRPRRRRSSTPAAGRLAVDGQQIRAAKPISGGRAGAMITVALRPEMHRSWARAAAPNNLSGTVDDVTFLGSIVRVRVSSADGSDRRSRSTRSTTRTWRVPDRRRRRSRCQLPAGGAASSSRRRPRTTAEAPERRRA